MLEIAKNLIGWDSWKKKQSEARKEGRMVGLALARHSIPGPTTLASPRS